MIKRKKKTEQQKMGKIKHKKTEVDGIVFDSKMESQYYEYLKDLKSKGIVKEFTLQPLFVLQQKFIIINDSMMDADNPLFDKMKKLHKVPTIAAIKYIADFDVTYSDGTRVIVDTKGIETADFKIKKKMFMMKFPHLKLDILTWDKSSQSWITHDEYQKAKRSRTKK